MLEAVADFGPRALPGFGAPTVDGEPLDFFFVVFAVADFAPPGWPGFGAPTVDGEPEVRRAVPGVDRWRPAQASPLANLLVAGDWTATGWPATMEGAVRSGYLAAEALLARRGETARFVQPDLTV